MPTVAEHDRKRQHGQRVATTPGADQRDNRVSGRFDPVLVPSSCPRNRTRRLAVTTTVLPDSPSDEAMSSPTISLANHAATPQLSSSERDRC
jgi:hypothetical protein